MKRFQQLVSCYLALCLAGAGAVSLSPVLHSWVEHGGQGPVHLHLGMGNGVTALSHPPLRQDSQSLQPDRVWADTRLDGLVFHGQGSFRVPTFPLQRAWHAFVHLLEGHGPAASSPTSPDGDPGHEHHSLPQLLAGGLIDQHLDLPPLAHLTVSQTIRASFANALLLTRDWDAPSLSRGPPPARS